MAGIRYASCDGLRLAYQVVGDGPLDLVLLCEWTTPLEARWELPAIAGPLNRLASFARVISFDKRGVGLSDPAPVGDVSTPELWVRDLMAVLDHAGAGRVVAFGASEGGPIAALFAASVPERTEAVVLANTGARLTAAPDYPFGRPHQALCLELDEVVAHWQDGAEAGGPLGDPVVGAWLARQRRHQASPTVGRALLHMFAELDVRHVLGSIAAPTLVVHRRDHPQWGPEHGRFLADHITQARHVELAGSGSYWWAEDPDRLIDEVEEFLLGERRSSPSDRVLATLLLSDIVASTERLATAGDRAWGELLDRHDAVTRWEVERRGGRVVKRTGDGLIATFDGPARAIEGARAIRRAVEDLGMTLRVCVHTGEVEPRGDDLGGLAVHLAARVLAATEPGEIWVTAVVKALVAGSALGFAERGRHELRGIPDAWELYALVDDDG